MRICRKCGAQVADGVMACPRCGAPMIEPPKTPQQDVEQNKVMALTRDAACESEDTQVLMIR